MAYDESVGNVRVRYIDFGNSCEVPFNTLRVLPKELHEQVRPCLTFIVKPKNMKDEPESHDRVIMKDRLERISEIGSSQVFKITGYNYPHIIMRHDVVELFDVISNRSVNEYLNSLVQKRYYHSDLSQKVLTVNPYNLRTLFAIDTLRVDNNIMMSSSHVWSKGQCQHIHEKRRKHAKVR